MRLVAGLFLWKRAAKRRRPRPKDLLLPLAGALLVLALAGPTRPARHPRLALVLDRSASMAAGKRWPNAKEEARRLLAGRKEVLVVLAGNAPEVLGPGPPEAVLKALETRLPGDRTADAQAALLAAARALPGAPVVWIGDRDPGKTEGYLPAGGREENVGITHLGRDALVLGHQGPAPREVRLRIDGEVHTLRLPATGFRTLALSPAPRHRAEILGEDALSLDDQSTYLQSRPRAAVETDHPALLRLLRLLGVEPSPRAAIRVLEGTPQNPDRPTLAFAREAIGSGVVADREAGHPFLAGAAILGERLAVPPPPGPGLAPIAVDDAGRGLIYSDGQSLYLPPIETLFDKPYFPVLVYNFFAPYLRAAKPLGADGVRRPGVRGGVAYVLENPEETLLPAGDPKRPLREGNASLAPLFLLLAAALMLLESRL